MRKIPKEFIKILDKRTKAAKEFIYYDTQIVEWMKERDIDIEHPDIKDHIQTGCCSIVEPDVSREAIMHFLRCWTVH